MKSVVSKHSYLIQYKAKQFNLTFRDKVLFTVNTIEAVVRLDNRIRYLSAIATSSTKTKLSNLSHLVQRAHADRFASTRIKMRT